VTDHIFVVTGGPGSGKSSLIEALASSGFQCMPEAGRAIIQDQITIDGNALPWSDRNAFIELMLCWDLRSHREASAMSGPVICDRGVPDTLGYLALCGLPVPPYIRRAAELFRYNHTVFIAPHWPEIYTQDSERKQSETEAAETCLAMSRIYAELGYELLPLPFAGIEERVEFVRSRIAKGLRSSNGHERQKV
jgi:predicted ATPase